MQKSDVVFLRDQFSIVLTVLQQKEKHDDAMAMPSKRMLRKVGEFDQEIQQY